MADSASTLLPRDCSIGRWFFYAGGLEVDRATADFVERPPQVFADESDRDERHPTHQRSDDHERCPALGGYITEQPAHHSDATEQQSEASDGDSAPETSRIGAAVNTVSMSTASFARFRKVHPLDPSVLDPRE